MRLGTRLECIGSSLRVSGTCQDGAREFTGRRLRLIERLWGDIAKGIGKIARNTPGDRQRKTVRLAVGNAGGCRITGFPSLPATCRSRRRHKYPLAFSSSPAAPIINSTAACTIAKGSLPTLQPAPFPTATLSLPSPLLPAAQPCRRRPLLHHLSHAGAVTRDNNLDVDLARVAARLLEQRQGVGLPSTCCNRSTSVLSTKTKHPFRHRTQQLPAAFSTLSTTSPSSSPLPSCLSNIIVKALDTLLPDLSPSSSSTAPVLPCRTAPFPVAAAARPISTNRGSGSWQTPSLFLLSHVNISENDPGVSSLLSTDHSGSFSVLAASSGCCVCQSHHHSIGDELLPDCIINTLLLFLTNSQQSSETDDESLQLLLPPFPPIFSCSLHHITALRIESASVLLLSVIAAEQPLLCYAIGSLCCPPVLLGWAVLMQ
ncbi:hypothetical protein BHE74_00010101 [Ensete ventricosum]|nr:hypothetical protein BHE74_00010101 [Ensete ventricosum]